MPVDAGVYGQFAQPVRSVSDIQNGLAQQQTNALMAQHAGLQNQQLQTQMAQDAQLRQAAQGFGADPTANFNALLKTGNLKAAQDYYSNNLANKKTQADTDLASAHAGEFQASAAGKAMEQYRSVLTPNMTPDDMTKWTQALYQDPRTAPIVTAQFGPIEGVQAKIAANAADPAKWSDYLAANAVGMKDFIANQTTKRGQDMTSATAANEQGVQRRGQDISSSTAIRTTGMNNATSTANNRANIAKDFTIAGMGPDGTPNGSLDGMVDLIGTGKMQPPTGLALRNPRIVSLMEQVAQKYPNFDATDYGARQLAAKSFSTGKDGQSVQSANTALNHLDTLRQLATAQNNGDIRTVNDIKNRISKEFGGTAPANLQAAVTMVGPEISRAVIGAGGGQGDRDKVDAALASLVKGGPDQQAGTIGTMQDLFGGRLTEAQRTYERTTGRKDFADTLLSPAAQKVLAARSGSTSDSSDLHSKAQAILRGGK